MDWQCFQAIVTRLTQAREEKKVARLEQFQTQSCDSFLTSSLKLEMFFTHNFVSKWKNKKFKECLFTFPKDVVISVINFVENYYF